MAPLCYAPQFDPFLSLDCAPRTSTLAQSKERKGSHFAIWQPCSTQKKKCRGNSLGGGQRSARSRQSSSFVSIVRRGHFYLCEKNSPHMSAKITRGKKCDWVNNTIRGKQGLLVVLLLLHVQRESFAQSQAFVSSYHGCSTIWGKILQSLNYKAEVNFLISKKKCNKTCNSVHGSCCKRAGNKERIVRDNIVGQCCACCVLANS